MPNFSLKFKEAIQFADSKKVVLPDEYYSMTMKGRATTISGLASLSQIEYVINQLNKTLKEGKTLEDFKKAIREGDLSIGLPANRLDTIFRTNIQAAYNFGRWQQQEKVATTRPYLMYDAVNDNRTRPSHALLDNTILPRSDSFWQTHYPPLGFNCRCVVISLSETQARARGITKDKPDVQADEGFGLNVAQFKQSLESVVDKKIDELEIKFTKSSKMLAILKKKMLNDEIAMTKVNSMVSKNMIVGPVKDQYMNMLATLSAKDPNVGQLPVRLISEYIQNGSDAIKTFLTNKSQVSSDLTAAAWIKQAFKHLETLATNKTGKILRGDSATNKASILSTFEVGSIVRLVSPLSFTKENSVAQNKAGIGGVVFHVVNAKNVGVDVLKAGATTIQAQKEAEVLLVPDTNVKVDGVEKGIDGFTHVYLSVTDQEFTKEY